MMTEQDFENFGAKLAAAANTAFGPEGCKKAPENKNNGKIMVNVPQQGIRRKFKNPPLQPVSFKFDFRTTALPGFAENGFLRLNFKTEGNEALSRVHFGRFQQALTKKPPIQVTNFDEENRSLLIPNPPETIAGDIMECLKKALEIY